APHHCLQTGSRQAGQRSGQRHPAGFQTRGADPLRTQGTEVLMAPSPDSSGSVVDPVESPDVGDPPLPPIPDGAVMVTLRIARFNPENPDQYADSGGWQSFRVPCLPTDRLLNLLIYVKSYLDGSLTFRRSCAHGVCGSDAMQINGVNRLACK